MNNDLISVERLAALCAVDRETIRRWRKKGVRGTFLEAVDSTGLRGKPIYFTKEAILRFAEVNPKMMTDALRKALDSHTVQAVPVDSRSMQASVNMENNEQETVTVRLLKDRQRLLEQELAQVKLALEQMKGG